MPRPRRHPLRPAVQVAVMKYKGREIVAPEKFLPAMRELLAWYEGVGSIFNCPLCKAAGRTESNTTNCQICPWTIVTNYRFNYACEKNRTIKRYGRYFNATGRYFNATIARDAKPRWWATLRIRQLRHWIAIYEKAAAEVQP